MNLMINRFNLFIKTKNVNQYCFVVIKFEIICFTSYRFDGSFSPAFELQKKRIKTRTINHLKNKTFELKYESIASQQSLSKPKRNDPKISVF